MDDWCLNERCWWTDKHKDKHKWVTISIWMVQHWLLIVKTDWCRNGSASSFHCPVRVCIWKLNRVLVSSWCSSGALLQKRHTRWTCRTWPNGPCTPMTFYSSPAEQPIKWRWPRSCRGKGIKLEYHRLLMDLLISFLQFSELVSSVSVVHDDIFQASSFAARMNELVLDDQSGTADNLIFASIFDDRHEVIAAALHFIKAIWKESRFISNFLSGILWSDLPRNSARVTWPTSVNWDKSFKKPLS